MGRHRLGPHVVGQRVVVRHLLPDGRATDVLGTCTAWGGDSLTVDREGHGLAGDDLGSPGGAAKMGVIDKDHELVAALPPQEHDE